MYTLFYDLFRYAPLNSKGFFFLKGLINFNFIESHLSQRMLRFSTTFDLSALVQGMGQIIARRSTVPRNF